MSRHGRVRRNGHCCRARGARACCACCASTRGSCARGLTRLALFGSTARDDLGPKSDVDLLIEVDPARRFGLFAFLDLKNDLAAPLGRPVDLAFADAMRPRLLTAVLEDALEVF